MSVTTDQLKSLADLLNERRAEWNFDLNPLSLGEVRSIYEAYGVWWQALAKQKAREDWDAHQEGYESGWYDAEEAARDKAAELALAGRPQTYGGDVIHGETIVIPHPDGGGIEVPAEYMASDAFIDSVDYPDRDGKPSIYDSYWHGYDEDDPAEAAGPDDGDPDLKDGFGAPMTGERGPTDEGMGLARAVAATLGPEHTLNTPLKPIGRDRLPDPDVARSRLAGALANGSRGQLEALTSRAQRAPARSLAEADGIDDDIERAKGKRVGAPIPTLEEICAELVRQSVGTGVMPSVNTFDTSRPATWLKAWGLVRRLDMSWNELADVAGLKPRPHGRPQPQPA